MNPGLVFPFFGSSAISTSAHDTFMDLLHLQHGLLSVDEKMIPKRHLFFKYFQDSFDVRILAANKLRVGCFLFTVRAEKFKQVRHLLARFCWLAAVFSV